MVEILNNNTAFFVCRADMTRATLLRALEKPILIHFPYESIQAGDFDEVSETCGYRYNK